MFCFTFYMTWCMQRLFWPTDRRVGYHRGVSGSLLNHVRFTVNEMTLEYFSLHEPSVFPCWSHFTNILRLSIATQQPLAGHTLPHTRFKFRVSLCLASCWCQNEKVLKCVRVILKKVSFPIIFGATESTKSFILSRWRHKNPAISKLSKYHG
jgi:hypothetical protein